MILNLIELTNNILLYQNVNLIKPAEIDVGCGYRKSRKTMLCRKKCTTEGRLVLETEKFLSNNSLKNTSTVERVKLQQQPSQLIREFYSVSKQARSIRAVEIQNYFFFYQFVTRERRAHVVKNNR